MLTAAVPAAASRFDSSFYRTHDPVGYIQPDAQSVVSQFFGGGTGGMPRNSQANPFLPPHLVAGRRGTANGANGMPGPYSSYTQSIISQQQHDTASVAGSTVSSQMPRLSRTQFDRYRQSDQGNGTRTAGTTDGGYGRSGMGSSVSESDYSYKGGDEDASTTYTTSQAGVTEY